MKSRKAIESNLAVLANILVAATVLYTILSILKNEPLTASPVKAANNARKPAGKPRIGVSKVRA